MPPSPGADKVKVRILQVLFAQVINKHLGMNTSINLDSLTEMSQNFWRSEYLHKKKDTYLDKLTV